MQESILIENHKLSYRWGAYFGIYGWALQESNGVKNYSWIIPKLLPTFKERMSVKYRSLFYDQARSSRSDSPKPFAGIHSQKKKSKAINCRAKKEEFMELAEPKHLIPGKFARMFMCEVEFFSTSGVKYQLSLRLGHGNPLSILNMELKQAGDFFIHFIAFVRSWAWETNSIN